MGVAFSDNLRGVLGRALAGLARRVRRPQAPARGFGYRLTRWRRRGYAVEGFPRSCLLRLVDYPDLLLRAGLRETIKAGRSALVVRAELPVGGRMVAVAYKRVRRRTWLKTFTSFLRPERALRNWRMGHELLARGINTPRPLAAIVPRWYLWCRNSWLATEWLAGGESLSGFLDRLRDSSTSRPSGETVRCGATHPAPIVARRRSETRRLIHAAAGCVGNLVGRMHAAGVGHRDLKASNVMIAVRSYSNETPARLDLARPEEPLADGDLRAWVIDLDGATLRPRVSVERRARNLARLAVGLAHRPEITNSVRLRFLQAYLAAARADAGSWKESWRQVSMRARPAV